MEPRLKHVSAATLDRGRQRRQQILDAALELCVKGGYRGTSLAALAESVGVTQPTVLHHFGNKEGLMRALVERTLHDLRGSTSHIFAPEVGSALNTLPMLADHVRAHRMHVQVLAVLTSENLHADDAAHEMIVEHYRWMREAVAAGLRREQEVGRIRPDVDLGFLAVQLVATADGLRQQWLRDPSSVDLERSLAEVSETVRASVGLEG